MENLREARKEAGLTQKRLAELLGISQQSYSDYENNRTFPDENTLIKLANVLNVSLDYLLGRTDELGAVVMPGAVQLTDEEEELLRLFRKLPAEYRIHELESLRMFAGEPMKPALPKKA